MKCGGAPSQPSDNHHSTVAEAVAEEDRENIGKAASKDPRCTQPVWTPRRPMMWQDRGISHKLWESSFGWITAAQVREAGALDGQRNFR